MGLDIVDLEGFRAQLGDPASAFAQATFTPAELADADDRPSDDRARHLAARYAAKEALIKAWSGSRWGQSYLMPGGVDYREIELITDARHRPAMQIHGELARVIGEMELNLRAHVSLSHDGGVAAAVVILEVDATADRAGDAEG